MKLNPLVLALGLIPLAGCGGDNSTPVTQSTYSVTAIDGYLNKAQVWLDINGNFQLDVSEPNTLSGEDGVADLDVTGIENPEQYPVVVQAIAGKTIDIGDDINAPENNIVNTSYMMSAPAGETDITPLSTLVHIILEQKIAAAENVTNNDLSEDKIAEIKAEAVAQVAGLLGIASDEVLGDFIEKENDAIGFAAENIVAAKILPETPEKMSQVVEETKLDDPDDSETKSTFLANAEAATGEIKNTIESAGDNADFSAIDSVFSESDDTADTGDDNAATDSPLIGTWNNQYISFTFNSDMTYSMEQKVSDDEASDSTTGTETGIYTFNETTGEITVTEITSDNNGTSGLSDMLDENQTLSFSLSEADSSGNSLTFAYDEGDEQGTFVLYKTLATSATDFVTANSNFYFIDLDDDGGKIDIEYDDVQWNSSTNSLSTTMFRFDNGSFVEATDNGSDYILTSTGWAYGDNGDETLTPQADGSMVYSDNNESSTITGQEWSLSGANIYQFQETLGIEDSLLASFDESAEFSDGAALYEMTSVSTSVPVYSLWLGSCEQPEGFTDLAMIKVAGTGLCNTQYDTTDGSAITSIADITASTAFSGTIRDDFNGMNFNGYLVRLVDGGNVDIYNYVDPSNSPDLIARVFAPDTVTWEASTVNGETLITFSTEDDSLSNFNGKFLTEIDGYLRAGNIWSNDDDEAELMFNDIAKDDILEAFTASTADLDDDSAFTFTTDWLNGKTLYNVFQNQDGDTGPYYWEMAVFTFTDSTFSGYSDTAYNGSGDTVSNMPYEITTEGYITFADLDDGNGSEYIRALSAEEDHLALIWSSNIEDLTAPHSNQKEFFFYDLDTAQQHILDNPISTSNVPEKFTAEYLAGKTLYTVWFGDGNLANDQGQAVDENGNLITNSDNEIELMDVAVVYEITYNADGTLTATGVKNAISDDTPYHYLVDTAGVLRIEEEQNEATEGNIICDNSNPDYLKTHFIVNGVFDNVDLFFFDKQKALDFANGLSSSIPACAP